MVSLVALKSHLPVQVQVIAGVEVNQEAKSGLKVHRKKGKKEAILLKKICSKLQNRGPHPFQKILNLKNKNLTLATRLSKATDYFN
jgi:hypothetical protein